MDLLDQPTPFAQAAALQLRTEAFTLIDIGCGDGGIMPCWSAFGEKLQVFGFDPNAAEIATLNAQTHLGRHVYTPGFVGLPDDHPFAQMAVGRPQLGANPWGRLAIAWWIDLQKDSTTPQEGSWGETGGRSPTPAPMIALPEFIDGQGSFPVDFIKLDVDGADLDILHSLDKMLAERRVLGLGIEVNYIGTDDPACNTFHNIDRFMRSQGFDLFDVSRRKYSGRFLPAPSLSRPYPADTTFGRLLQGDAIYARDLAAPRNLHFAEAWGAEAIIKLAALFSLFHLPDSAAELLVRFRDRLDKDFVSSGLDLLVLEATGHAGETYRDYIDAFRKGDERFSAEPHAKLAGTRSARLTEIDPAVFFKPPSALGSAKVKPRLGWIDVVTGEAPWSYALDLRVDETRTRPTGEIRVQLKIEMLRGKVGVALQTSRGDLLQEVFVEAGTSRVEFRTSAPFGAIILRNASLDGQPSHARLRIEGLDAVG